MHQLQDEFLTIGQCIRQARKGERLKQIELAEHTSMPRTALSKIERDVQACKVSELLAICEALGTTPNGILGISKGGEQQ